MVKILVVEDNRLNAELYYALLFEETYKIEIAIDGFMALSKLETNHYDLIIMDIKLPEMDGVKTTQLIKELYQIPILCCTAYALPGDKEYFLGCGMDYYLAKPVSRKNLIDGINYLVKRGE